MFAKFAKRDILRLELTSQDTQAVTAPFLERKSRLDLVELVERIPLGAPADLSRGELMALSNVRLRMEGHCNPWTDNVLIRHMGKFFMLASGAMGIVGAYNYVIGGPEARDAWELLRFIFKGGMSGALAGSALACLAFPVYELVGGSWPKAKTWKEIDVAKELQGDIMASRLAGHAPILSPALKKIASMQPGDEIRILKELGVADLVQLGRLTSSIGNAPPHLPIILRGERQELVARVIECLDGPSVMPVSFEPPSMTGITVI